MTIGPISLMDRLSADVFGLAYREYLLLKSTHYKWSHLAPQAVEHLRKAHGFNWSLEKLADYLSSTPSEASEFLKRYIVSEKINSTRTAADAIRKAFKEWAARFEDLSEAEREACSNELSQIVSNRLFAAFRDGSSLESLSLELEPQEPSSNGNQRQAGINGDAGKSTTWGPQWRD